jgi:drug/metabolite transporter (DMT)-like permease
MNYLIGIAAALGCAACNGCGVVLQKVGVNQVKATPKLITNLAYMSGIALNLIGWLLTLLAVGILPLFLVQSIVASNIVIAAILDQQLLKDRIPRYGYRLIVVILIGLCILSLTAAPVTKAPQLSLAITLFSLIGLIAIGFIGVLLIKLKHNHYTPLGLAILAGTSFGALSIIGRLLVVNLSILDIIINPLAWMMLLYSLVGVTSLTFALKHASVTKVNSVSVAMQTVVPAVIGITLLGDTVKDGFMVVTVVTLIITLVASITLASLHHKANPERRFKS